MYPLKIINPIFSFFLLFSLCVCQDLDFHHAVPAVRHAAGGGVSGLRAVRSAHSQCTALLLRGKHYAASNTIIHYQKPLETIRYHSNTIRYD